jgi:hypothetical protein
LLSLCSFIDVMGNSICIPFYMFWSPRKLKTINLPIWTLDNNALMYRLGQIHMNQLKLKFLAQKLYEPQKRKVCQCSLSQCSNQPPYV